MVQLSFIFRQPAVFSLITAAAAFYFFYFLDAISSPHTLFLLAAFDLRHFFEASLSWLSSIPASPQEPRATPRLMASLEAADPGHSYAR